MEFLGDSVLDYLITRYLYEDAKTIYSGKISEIRSALVNNATYASLAVSKCDFHRYINLHSEHLQMLINRYIEVMAHGDRPLNIFGALEDMDITQGIENNDEIFPRKPFIDAIDLSLFKYGVCVLSGVFRFCDISLCLETFLIAQI